MRPNYGQKKEVRAAELPKILAEILGQKGVEDGVEATVEVEGEEGDRRQEKLVKRYACHVSRRLSIWRTPRLPHGVHLHSKVFKCMLIEILHSLDGVNIMLLRDTRFRIYGTNHQF